MQSIVLCPTLSNTDCDAVKTDTVYSNILDPSTHAHIYMYIYSYTPCVGQIRRREIVP